jgi:hypothetical protein
MPDYPWSLDAVPVRIVAKARRIPQGQQYNAVAGPLPWSPAHTDAPVEEGTLVPYGATTLRISEFPVVRE